MLIERMRKRLAADRASFIEPCLPSPAASLPPAPNWLHEIKHDGFRLMARRDSAGIRLQSRNAHEWTDRYPAVNHLPVKSCLIDGEVVACDEHGLAVFDLLRRPETQNRCPAGCLRSARTRRRLFGGPSPAQWFNLVPHIHIKISRWRQRPRQPFKLGLDPLCLVVTQQIREQ
jgi:hypothetical protein